MTKETLDSLEALGEILRKIHNRLLSEGKIIRKDGKTIFIETEINKE